MGTIHDPLTLCSDHVCDGEADPRTQLSWSAGANSWGGPKAAIVVARQTEDRALTSLGGPLLPAGRESATAASPELTAGTAASRQDSRREGIRTQEGHPGAVSAGGWGTAREAQKGELGNQEGRGESRSWLCSQPPQVETRRAEDGRSPERRFPRIPQLTREARRIRAEPVGSKRPTRTGPALAGNGLRSQAEAVGTTGDPRHRA